MQEGMLKAANEILQEKVSICEVDFKYKLPSGLAALCHIHGKG
jgi:hypothetical protein